MKGTFLWIFILFIPLQGQTGLRPDLVMQTNHGGFIRSVALSPNGQLLATGGIDGTIQLWNTQSNRQILIIKAHPGIRIDPDKEIPAWPSSIDPSVNLFERIDGFGWADCVHAVSFSRDSKWLVSGSSDRTIKIWDLSKVEDLRKGRAAKTFNTGIRNWFVSFSDDGTRVISIGEDGSYRYWDSSSEKEVTDKSLRLNDFRLPWRSPDGNLVAAFSEKQKEIKLIDKATSQTRILEGHQGGVRSVAFSPNGRFLASCGWDRTVRLWNLTGPTQSIILGGHDSFISSIAFSKDGKTLASVGGDLKIKIWDIEKLKLLKILHGYGDIVTPHYWVLDDKILVSSSADRISIWDIDKGSKNPDLYVDAGSVRKIALNEKNGLVATSTHSLWPFAAFVSGLADGLRNEKDRNGVGRTPDLSSLWSGRFGPDDFVAVKNGDEMGAYDKSMVSDNSISLWNVETRHKRILKGHTSYISSLAFSEDGSLLASGDQSGVIWVWDMNNPGNRVTSPAYKEAEVSSLALSRDGKMLASITRTGNLTLWKITKDNELTLSPRKEIKVNLKSTICIALSIDDKGLMIMGWNDKKFASAVYETETGNEMKDLAAIHDLSFASFELQRAISTVNVAISNDQKFDIRSDRIGKLALYDAEKDELLAWLISFSEENWAVVAPDGRFDTNLLENQEGLNWIFPDNPLKPLPLEVFMRHYYEPGLLRRILAGEKFAPLPALAELNRAQPKVTIKEIKSSVNNPDLVNVSVEVESVTEEIDTTVEGRTIKKRLTSGVYDLRLFRDRQLVANATPRAKMQAFIDDAPRFVEESRTSQERPPLNAPEDKAWRTANDLSSTTKFDNAGKAIYTFRDIKIPQNGGKEFEFSAYAFNSDRVKSETSRLPFVVETPKTRVGKTYLISIGVNASENPLRVLHQSAKVAQNTQTILASRLLTDPDKIVGISMISRYRSESSHELAENNATKPKIKALFSLLGGTGTTADREALTGITNIAKVEPIQPEDTLIIVFSGHGDRDRNGFFYLLPYDVGPTADASGSTRKKISSDELSLWLRDVTAKEMIFVIDACYSEAIVQNEGFKPGPMGSRGLGQLAYDKGFKILSASQSYSAAYQDCRLGQSILGYALLQEGVIEGKADTVEPKGALTALEWLKYAEVRVPSLYQEVQGGRFGSACIQSQGEVVPDRRQTPRLFDFTRKLSSDFLIALE